MKSNRRFVFDTNVIVSALLFKTSVPRQALDRARTHGSLLLSLPTLQELNTVLNRSRFDKYIPQQERKLFLGLLLREVEQVAIVESVTDCRDPKDNKFLEVAINGQATCIISGDRDLLVLHPFRTIPILTPQAFLNHILQ